MGASATHGEAAAGRGSSPPRHRCLNPPPGVLMGCGGLSGYATNSLVVNSRLAGIKTALRPLAGSSRDDDCVTTPKGAHPIRGYRDRPSQTRAAVR